LHFWFFVPPQLPSSEIFLTAVADGLAEEEVLLLVVTGRVDVVVGRVLVVLVVTRVLIVLVVLRPTLEEAVLGETLLEDATLDDPGAPEDESTPHFPNTLWQPVPQ
jgi:hypothetical protein